MKGSRRDSHHSAGSKKDMPLIFLPVICLRIMAWMELPGRPEMLVMTHATCRLPYGVHNAVAIDVALVQRPKYASGSNFELPIFWAAPAGQANGPLELENVDFIQWLKLVSISSGCGFAAFECLVACIHESLGTFIEIFSVGGISVIHRGAGGAISVVKGHSALSNGPRYNGSQVKVT